MRPLPFLVLLVSITGVLLTSCVSQSSLEPASTVSASPQPISTQIPLPTITSTQTQTPTLTEVSIPTPTLTPTPILSASPTRTATPEIGIGVTRKDMVAYFQDLGFQFYTSDAGDGKLETRGFSPSEFTVLTLLGYSEHLTQVEMEITTSGEGVQQSTDYWHSLLGLVLPGNSTVLDEIQRYLPQAATTGKVELIHGYVKIILQVRRTTIKITILRAVLN